MTAPDPDATVDLTAVLTTAGTTAWEAVDELAARSDIERWAVVGGMMVMVHATRYGIPPPRTTDDADVVVDIRHFGRSAMRTTATLLTEMGFRAKFSTDGVTRYIRGEAVIDLLAPEGTGNSPVVTSPPGRAVAAPGATQALSRTEMLDVIWRPDRSTRVRIPSLLGAIVAKAAASTEIPSLDTHEQHKHLGDLALLLEVAASHADLSNMSADLTPKDRKRLRAAQSRLDHYQWPTRNQQRVVSTFVNDLLKT